MTQPSTYQVLSIPPTDADRLLALIQWVSGPTDTPCSVCNRSCWGSVCYYCRKQCSHEQHVPGYIIRHNGARDYRDICLTCGRRQSLPRGSIVLDICLDDHRDSQPCSHCGTTGAIELHHWAPRAIFEDPDDWPTAWLCVACHNLWHNKMREARGVSLNGLEGAA